MIDESSARELRETSSDGQIIENLRFQVEKAKLTIRANQPENNMAENATYSPYVAQKSIDAMRLQIKKAICVIDILATQLAQCLGDSNRDVEYARDFIDKLEKY